MTDNPVNKKPEEPVKPQAKPGESVTEKTQNAATDARTKLSEAAAHPAEKGWLSSITGYFESKPKLPPVHIVEKPAAPATSAKPATPAASGGVMGWVNSEVKTVKDTYNEYTNGKHSTKEKLLLAGTAALTAAAYVVPELKGMRGELKGATASLLKDGTKSLLKDASGELRTTEKIALGAKTEAQVNLDSVKALQDKKLAGEAERPLSTIVSGEKPVVKAAPFKIENSFSADFGAANPFVGKANRVEAVAPAVERKAIAPIVESHTPAPVEFHAQTLQTPAPIEFHAQTIHPPVAKAPSLTEVHSAPADVKARLKPIEAAPMTEFHARQTAHEEVGAAPAKRISESDAAAPAAPKPVKAPEVQQAPAATRPEIHEVQRTAPAVHVDAPLVAKPPIAADAESHIAASTKPAHVVETSAVVEPAVSNAHALRAETTEATKVHGVPVSDARPVAERPAPISDARPVAERPAPISDARPVAERPAPVAPAAQTSVIQSSEAELAATKARPDVSTSRLETTSPPQASSALRAESTIAETHIVSHSNALAENVHKLELPANASPELVAAKTRLQESSLLISQSPEKVKVLQNMQADLKVLEKSVPSEALADIRKNVAAMESPVASVEGSTLNAAEKQVTHGGPTEATHIPKSADAGAVKAETQIEAQAVKGGTTDANSAARTTENTEAHSVSHSRPAQSPAPSANAVTSQAPHAVSVRDQSLNLLEKNELTKPGREAASGLIQDTNDWASKSLAQRSQIVERLESNLKTLSADSGSAKEISSITKSVETLKLGTRAESAAVKADAEIGDLTSRLNPTVAENAEFKAAQSRLKENTQTFAAEGSKTSAVQLRNDLSAMERVAGKDAVAPVRQKVLDLEKAVAERDAASALGAEKPSFSTSTLSEVQTPRASLSASTRSEAALESHVPGVVAKQELKVASEQLSASTQKLQSEGLAILEKGGMRTESRKALVDVVQDSGNISRLEGAERTQALARIEKNLKVAAQDEHIATEAQGMSKTLSSVETSAAKSERLAQFDKTSAETLPKINEEVAGLKKSNFASKDIAEKAATPLKAIEEDAASLANTSDRSAALTRMQGNVDRLEQTLGKEAVAPLKENVDRLELSHRSSARAHAVEDTAARAQASREGLNSEVRDLAAADTKLSPAARTASQDVEKLTAGNQKLTDAEVARLRDNVGTISRDAEPATAARLHGHVHNIQTGSELAKLDKTLTNVSEDSVAVNRQAAAAAARNPEPSVVALHQATESLRLNGVAELSSARAAYEKALPSLARQDAITIDRSLSRIESQSAEASATRQKLADMQTTHAASVSQNPHHYLQGEAQRANDIHQLVTSHRDAVVAASLERTASVRNTSDLSVFVKPSTDPVSRDNVIAFGPRPRWSQIAETAERIASAAHESVLGLQNHRIAASVAVGVFVPQLAAAQTAKDNTRPVNYAQLDFSPKSQATFNASLVDTTVARASSGPAVYAPLESSTTTTAAKAEAPAKADVAAKTDVAPKTDVAAKSEAAVKNEPPSIKSEPLVRGALNADIASFSPTMQALLRTPDGGFDPTNGQRLRIGGNFVYLTGQAGTPQEAEAKATPVFTKVFKASTVTVGQPESTDNRSRIFYPPFKSPMSMSAKVRKPQSLLGVDPVKVATSTSFLTANLSPNTTSLTNPLSFTREKADGGSEDRRSGGAAVATNNGLDLSAASSATSAALLNATSTDPNGQPVLQTSSGEA